MDDTLSLKMLVERILNSPSSVLSFIKGEGMSTNCRTLNNEGSLRHMQKGQTTLNNSVIPRTQYMYTSSKR